MFGNDKQNTRIHNTFVALIHSRIVCDIVDAINEVRGAVWVAGSESYSLVFIYPCFWYDYERNLLFYSAFVLSQRIV